MLHTMSMPRDLQPGEDQPIVERNQRKSEREEEDLLCFSLRCLFALLIRLAECVVLRFGTAKTHGGRRSRRPAERESGIREAREARVEVGAA